MLQTLLAEGRPLLADGATGTNLFAMGLGSGESPERWNAERPDQIRSLHQAFVEAGSDIILTNSFGGNRRRLALHRLEDRVHELNRLAAEIARSVADKAGRKVVVAGSVGPTGDLLAPLGPLTEEEAVEVFVEQIEGLKAGGADVVWIETMSASEEVRAAAAAAAKAGTPYTVTASFDTAGRTMMGVPPAALDEIVEAFDPKPLAFGANCGVGASDLLVAILAMSDANSDSTLIAKANAGVPQWHGAEIHYSGTPELMERYAGLAVDCGAKNRRWLLRQYSGPCRRYAPRTYFRKAGPRPTMESIIAALGALVAPPAAEATASGRTRRRERA